MALSCISAFTETADINEIHLNMFIIMVLQSIIDIWDTFKTVCHMVLQSIIGHMIYF